MVLRGRRACPTAVHLDLGPDSRPAPFDVATRGSNSATRVIDHVSDGAPAMRWQLATVIAANEETSRAKTFRLALAQTTRHLAGQHFVVRLTAPDGYTASRSYSVASAPDGSNEFEITVERLEDGEVSTFLHDEVVAGDELEVRGPIGAWFVWTGDAPALLIGGGSGLVPLMAMLRLARRAGRSDLVRLVVSVRSPPDLYYAGELPGPEATIAYTRQAPPTGTRPPGRLMLDDIAPAILPGATAYICGSAGFADAASDLCVGLGLAVDRIRVERFGPSG
jgi:ferredoxin-NADP reductase